MNTTFTIKNFRVFDENGTTIDFKPMTILTGCNSSGKSSVVKAAFLLNDYMKQVHNAMENGEKIELSRYKLDFTSYPNNLLGRFDKIIPEGSSLEKVTLEYTIHSSLIFKDVNVQFIFVKDGHDELNNAYLDSISFCTDEGVFYSSDKENGCIINLNIIGKYLPMYAKIEYLIYSLCYLNNASSLSEEERGDSISDDEIESQEDKIKSLLHEIGKDEVLDVVNYIRFKKEGDNHGFTSGFTKEQLTLLDWTEENNSFFNIPILDYLKAIKKEDIQSVIERELIPENDDNTYLASPAAVLSASKKVICAFLESRFDTFDAFFRDFEHTFLGNLVLDTKDSLPCLFQSIKLKQHYLTNHPESCYKMGEAIDPFEDDEERIREGEKKHEIERHKSKEQKIKEWEESPLSFDILYQVVMLWNEKYAPGDTVFYKGGQKEYYDTNYGEFSTPGSFFHFAFGMLSDFAHDLAIEILSSSGFENMAYVSSSRATVKKLYALEENNDFTRLLQRYFESKRLFEERNKYEKPAYKVNDFTNRWIKQFGIGESLSFQLDEEGLGVKIFVNKSTGSTRILSDEGYGITQLLSVLLQIETAILSAHGKKSKEHIGLYCIDNYNNNNFHFEESTIAIEEPEIHLHPSYQSKLAEMFVEAYSNYNIHFIIETHSEYLVRKLQTLVAKEDIKAVNVSIQYVYSPDIEQRPLYTPQVKSISVKSDGRLTDSFGTGFFDEADNAAMELLTLKEEDL